MRTSPEGAGAAATGGGAAGVGRTGPFGPPLPRPVFYGLAVGSVGGPLGLAALFVPSTLDGAASSSALIVLVGGLLFAFPVLSWYRYAKKVASAGGLYSFVEAAAGAWPARFHGAAWAVSYFLYLPSTMAYLLWDVLPVGFGGMGEVRTSLELVLPVAMVVGLVFWRTGMLSLVAGAAVGQVVLVGVLAGYELTSAPKIGSFALHVPAATAAQFAASVSLLFVCGSLPLYFGSELRRPTRDTSRALPVSIGLGAACALVASISLRSFAPALGATVPGYKIASSLGGRALGVAVLIGAVVSVLTLVLLEYVALTRLLHAMAGVGARHAELGVGLAFVASAALALIAPGATYSDLLKPSLVALYLSEIVVFATYPLFGERLRARDVVVAVVSSGLMAYGIYNLFRS